MYHSQINGKNLKPRCRDLLEMYHIFNINLYCHLPSLNAWNLNIWLLNPFSFDISAGLIGIRGEKRAQDWDWNQEQFAFVQQLYYN